MISLLRTCPINHNTYISMLKNNINFRWHISRRNKSSKKIKLVVFLYLSVHCRIIFIKIVYFRVFHSDYIQFDYFSHLIGYSLQTTSQIFFLTPSLKLPMLMQRAAADCFNPVGSVFFLGPSPCIQGQVFSLIIMPSPPPLSITFS